MKHQLFIILLFIFYIVAMTAVMIWQGIGIAPDRYALVLLLGSLLVKKTRAFLFDWIPFLLILISYDFLRGFADNLSQRVHYQEMIDFDINLFGYLPTIKLQELFFTPNHIAWYDLVATVIYFLHFALPLGFGFILWLYNRNQFRLFITGLLLLSYSAWITYIIYPAAPPWLASQEGFLPPLTKIMDQTFQAFPDKLNLPTIYKNFNPNPVAAVPSLHAAYPFLVFLFAVNFFKKKALLFFPYVLLVWASIVYLGEHYVVDVIIGALYAAIFFMLAKQLHNHVKLFDRIIKLWLKKIIG